MENIEIRLEELEKGLEKEQMSLEVCRYIELARFCNWADKNTSTYMRICNGTISDEKEMNELFKMLINKKFYALAHSFMVKSPQYNAILNSTEKPFDYRFEKKVDSVD